VRSASLVVSCDDRFTLWVNGRQLAEETDWQKIVIVDISGELRSGDNTVALHGVNTGGPGALAVWLIWEDSAGARGDLVSDGEWLISDVPVPGWREPEFDDRGWKPAAVHGQVAYGKNVHGGEPHARVYRSPYSQWADGLDNGLAELRSARDPDQARKALDRLEKDLMEARRKLWEQQKRNAGGRE
jgi:hypothetical protein